MIGKFQVCAIETHIHNLDPIEGGRNDNIFEGQSIPRGLRNLVIDEKMFVSDLDHSRGRDDSTEPFLHILNEGKHIVYKELFRSEDMEKSFRVFIDLKLIGHIDVVGGAVSIENP